MLNRPKLLKKDAPYMDAFSACSSARPSTMGGPGAIPINEVLSYLQLVGIASGGERAKYLRLIQQLDSTYLTHFAEKAAQTS